MNLGKVTLFNVAMYAVLVLTVAILAPLAPADPNPRHLFEVDLVIILVVWIAALLIGVRRIMRTGKLF